MMSGEEFEVFSESVLDKNEHDIQAAYYFCKSYLVLLIGAKEKGSELANENLDSILKWLIEEMEKK